MVPPTALCKLPQLTPILPRRGSERPKACPRSQSSPGGTEPELWNPGPSHLPRQADFGGAQLQCQQQQHTGSHYSTREKPAATPLLPWTLINHLPQSLCSSQPVTAAGAELESKSPVTTLWGRLSSPKERKTGPFRIVSGIKRSILLSSTLKP